MTFTVKATRTLKIPFGICGVFLMIHLIIITLQVRSVDGEFSSLQASQWYKATVNYWPFEDVSNNSTLDYTGSNDGQISGRFHTISGIVGSALALSGENSWVDFGVLPSSCLNEPSTCTSGFTIAFWLKIPEFQSNKIILQLGEHRYSRGFTLWTRKSTTNHKKSIGFSVNTRLRKYMWLQEWNSTDWNHIALKWDNRTRGLSIYVNCSLAQFINQSGAVEPKKDDKASRLILGASHAMKKNIKLLVDEFAIWDRPISDRTLCMLSRVYTVNGNFTEWSSFSACSVTCGNGTMKRIRTCTSPPPKNRGKNCSDLGASRETKPCFLTNCPLDGNFSEWSVFSKCSKSCGTGLKRRTRTCSNPVPKHGGRNCSRLGSASEEWECNTHSCPIDGGYSVWTEFTQCDVSCGNGTRQRTRSCSNPKPLHGGRNCSHLGPNVEIGICDTNLCPIHGGFSEWTAFSECTKSCGNGTQRRARKCSNPEPKHGGRNCSSLGPMIEIQQCNVHHCPKNGGYTQWTDFSECTKSCGNGTKIRTRNCTNPEPQYGGKNCSILGKNTEFQQCNTHYCSVNGGYTQWSPFSECTKSCGNGTQIRTRNCSNPEPNYGGNNCSGLGADTDLQFCNTPHCPIDGGYTQWTKFSACSKSCGEGNMTKRRNCTNPKPQYGGNNCSRLGDPVSVQGCNLRPCPVDGNFTEWTKFSKCSRSCGVGLRNRTRYCINPEPMHGGNDCHGKHIEIEVCNILPCPIDGEYTQWSNFSACSKTCDSGIMRRTRSCSNPAPQFGGKHCSVLGYAEEMKTCNDFPCPVDGNYSSWSNYSVCSKSCGNGTMERQRNCSNPAPRHSGNDCSSLGPTKEIKRCNEFPCPIHGNFSAWSIFSVCSKSCGNGTKTRTRNCSNPFPKHRGRNCSLLGPLKEVRSCNVFSCPVHGNYSSWSNFSICSKSCGNGSQTRFRSCTNPKPQHNGNNCSSLGSAIDVRVCNVFPCPVDGGYTEWGNFTHCTKSCGIGAMYRTRNCSNPAPQYGGKNCSSIGPAVEETTCNEHPCPIHGGYTPWSEFSHCSKTCGEGTKQRTRNCSNPLPQFGGSNCSRLGMPIDLEECYLAPCPIDGGYNEWSQFSQCTRSCGGGKQKRWRRCNNPTPKHGGKGCARLGHASQIQPCHSFPCPIHGNYSEWSGFESCTRTCGGGKRIRRRNCTSPPPAHGGRNCSGLGPSTDSSECNNQSCPDIVFEIAVNLTSEKWHDRLAASDNEDRAHLIQVIQIGVQKIMGYKAVSGVNNFQFKKGSVIAEFSVSLFHSQYQGITKLQDAIYVDGKIKNLRVAPVNFTSVDVPVMPPLNITATNTSSTTILLKWHPIPLNYSNGPILEYRITFTEVQKSVHEENQDLWQRIVDGNKLSAFVTGLKKYTTYYFRMGGINRRGVGLDSMPITATTDEDVPSQSPLDVFASNRSSTSVYVQWSPIPEQFIHGILLGYHINFTYLDPAGSGHVMAGVHATGASNTSILIHGLLKFTNYSVQVSGFTVKGDGLLSNQVTVRTDEDVPSRPPANVTGYNITSTCIRVQWEQIPTRYVHGILLGYKVSFIATDCGNQRPWNETTVSPSTTSAVITNLRKYTKYMVSVEGFTIKGSGQHSKCVAITTAEDKPDAYPANVTGFNKSSTSLFVEWQEIPPKHRKGILLGYKISYAPKPSYQPLETVTVDSTRSAVTLVNLKKYTWYNIRVAGFTIKGLGPYPPQTLEIRTSEDVPSKPAISVRARNTSHTSLLVEWNEIPRGYIHGVLLGYRVLFWRFNESRDTHEKIVTGPDVHHVRLTDLWIYTKYKIQVLGFTAAGSGSVSKEKVVSTDEFTPSQPPVNVKALNKTSPTKITVQWNPIPDNFYVHGILRGYKVLYKAIAIANEKLEGELPTKYVIVSPSTLSTVLENLDTFTRYEIEVLAFTIKGYGVKSKAITAETCNCHSTLYTNWWINPPYVDYPGSNKTGIITPILKLAVQACCGNCTEHGNSHIDFQNTDVGEPAMKSGLLEFKRNFEETTELHFPVYGFMDQTRYSNNYGFVPFVQSPGLALIIIGDEKGTAASLLLRSLAFCFPILFLCITMLWVSSLAMWFVETASNERHFPHNVLPGSWEAMWWAFASMTTLGYGDRIPKTPFGRLLGLSWILMGVVMITCFNSTMTTLLTTRILDKEIMLYGTKIAAIQNSTGYRLAIRKNARVNPNGKEYANLQEVYEALQNREVKGMLIDAFTVGSKKELFNRRDLRISKLLDHSAAYGAALGGEAKKLQKCLQKYVGEQRSEISKIVQQNVDTIKITPESLSVERSSGLFDPQFPTYVNTMIACGVLLAVMWMVGAKFEFAKKMGWINLRMKAKAEKALPRRIELMRNKAELKLEMSRIVSIFRINCSRRIQTLREKHKRELLHLARLKRQAESVVIQKGSFRRDSFFTLTFGAIKTQDQSNSERNGHTKQNSSHRAESESEIETMV